MLGIATPLGVSADLKSAVKKQFDLLKSVSADLQSAAVWVTIADL